MNAAKDDSELKTNKEITKDCKIRKEYWICKKKEGAFPKKLKVFKEERLKQKKLGNHVKQLSIKNSNQRWIRCLWKQIFQVL